MDRVLAGELSVEEAQEDPDWHVMSNWLGFESYRVATYRIPVVPGDRLLLCTDGLTNMLDDNRIAEILRSGAVEFATTALVDAANDAGGVDNISAVVVEVLEADPVTEPAT
jgi:protein phosphatase